LSDRTLYPKEVSDRLTLSADLPEVAGTDAVEIRGFLGRHRLVTERESVSPPGRSIEEADVDAKDASLRLLGSRRASFGSLRFGLDGHARFDLEASAVRRTLGASGEVLSRETEVSVADARRVGGGVFLEGERSFAGDRVRVALGLRGDVVESENRGGFFGDHETSRGALAGLLAITVRPAGPLSATLQYVRGFREPTLSDRYFRGVSGRGFVVGNPDLLPEQSDQFDLALRVSSSERLRFAPGTLVAVDAGIRYENRPGSADVRRPVARALDLALALLATVLAVLTIAGDVIAPGGSRGCGIVAEVTIKRRRRWAGAT
jgi:hypothetical protein